MRCGRRIPLLAPVTVVAMVAWALLAGCRDGALGRAAAARAREWSALVAQKQRLDVARTTLRTERARLASAPVHADGTAATADAQALARTVDERQRVVAAASTALEEGLARFAAGFALRAGEPPPAALVAAVHMKSDEDIAIASEWIERGGDYRHALAIYETQRRADPGYAPLAQAIARAEEMRAVTPARFAQVVPGMSTTEVRALLGPVNGKSVVRRPGEHVEAWFYPRAGGGAAGVYFRYDPRRQAFLVYQAELDAARVAPAGSLAG